MNLRILKLDSNRGRWWGVVGFCCLGGSVLAAVSADDQAGHDRMVAELAESTAELVRNHPYLGEERVQALRARIATITEKTAYSTRHRLYFEAAAAELEIGNVEACITLLEQAHAVMDDAFLDAYKRTLTEFQLGAAYLRLGEVENCCRSEEGESCILPIQGGGLHTKERGSLGAIKHLSRVVDQGPGQEFFYYAARWLLNIAYMTLDQYPDGVPSEYLIAREAFADADPFPRFRNIAPTLGVNTFSNAGGAVIEDFDGDGWLDIATSTWEPGGEMQLHRADGTGGFLEVSAEAGLAGITGGLNMVQADYNNDGHVDLLVLRGGWLGRNGRQPNSLLRNNGDGSFTDVTFAAGLAEQHFPTQTAAWADFDNDGHLDLYVGNESSSGTTTYGGTTFEGQISPSQLFRNNGDGTFNDVAAAAGVQNMRFTKGVSWGDFNGDRWPDLLVSNYGRANRLYQNNGDSTFTDVARASGVQNPQMSFPAWFWDFDNDGALDIYIASYGGHVASVGAHYLGLRVPGEVSGHYRGDGQGGFVNLAKEQGLSYPVLPMGSNFGDLNNDGFLDFYLGTGDPNYWSLMPNVLFRNDAGDGFTNVTMSSGMGHLQKGHGVAIADLDNDGDLDVFEQMGGAYAGDKFNDVLYENPGFSRRSVTIELVGRQSNRSAIGARIHAQIGQGAAARSVYRWVNSGGSFGGNPLRQTIGLGGDDEIQRLEVYWPTSETTQIFENVPAGQLIRIIEGEERYEPIKLRAIQLGSAEPER